MPVVEAVVDRLGRRAAVRHVARVFAVTWFISTARAAQLPELMLASGATLAAMMGIAGLVRPVQVVGRVIEFTFLKRTHLARRSGFHEKQNKGGPSCM